MKLYIATDHGGFALKESLKPYLASLGHEVEDCGAFTLDASDDYPDFITPCAEKVASTPGSMGIIIGGSGEGEAMAANRVKGVRAAVYYGEVSRTQTDIDGKAIDIITSMRDHNDANILSLGARFLTEEEMRSAIARFIETPFSENERHARRLAKF